MIGYTIGNCINCGQQAQVKNPNGKVVGPISGSSLIEIVLSGPKESQFAGHVSHIGTLPLCPKCDIKDITADQAVENCLKSPLGFLKEDDSELKYLTDRSLRLLVKY